MLVSMNASTGMELLPSPIDAADPGSHLGEQLEEVAAGFCSLFLFACKFVQISPYQTVYRGVLFHGYSPNLLSTWVLNRESNVFRHVSYLTLLHFNCIWLTCRPT